MGYVFDRDEAFDHIINECNKLAQRVKYYIWLDVKVGRLGTVQVMELRAYYKMVYAQTIICTGECDAESSLWFQNTKRSPNPGQKIRPNDN